MSKPGWNAVMGSLFSGGELKMKRMLILTAAVLLPTLATAQTKPTLHMRGNAAPDNQQEIASGISTLPSDASGEYAMDEEGSVVQITIEHNRLTGYVTKMEHDTSLTLFFDHAAVNGNQLSFRTRMVHGLRYSFSGAIVRGDVESPSLNGYYRLAGNLTVKRNGTKRMERISLKSTPRISGSQ
jgi:hypothetical protein